ncbi:Uncharacterised protein [Vibrio vulnificus]|nr:hypothetical protein VVS222_00445 [Vibrio vulnificus]SUQ29901.1 Uncharacterised protein [Vibrio vulnificus]
MIPVSSYATNHEEGYRARFKPPIMDGAIHKINVKEQQKLECRRKGGKYRSRKDKKGTYVGAFSIALSFTHEKGIFV